MRLLRPGALPLDVTRLAAVNNSGHAAFYYLEGHIVGCAHLAIYPNLAITMVSLEGVVVDPQFRRLGIARTLVTYLVEYARKRQLQRVVLLTEPENAEARNLYASIGFQEFDLKRFRFYF
jgi:N-acetylglutamate synthase-like GNAT family acetyltransferase